MKLCNSISVTDHPGLLKIFYLVLIAFFLLPAPCFSAEVEPSDEIVQIAEDALKEYKEHMPGSLIAMGFRSREEMDNATIGEGFLEYIVHSNSILNDKSKNLYEISTPSTKWKFIVKTPERVVMFFDLNNRDEKWSGGGFGAAGSAKRLNEVIKAWPQSSGYSHKYISVNTTRARYIAISEGENLLGFVRLQPDSNASNFNPRGLKTSTEILPAIIKRAEEKKAIQNESEEKIRF